MLYLQTNKDVKRLLYIIGLTLTLSVNAHGIGMGQLYAVLVNGGRNHLTNHERYWNDCAFIYRTLRHTFHIPKRNIIVLMSDGEPNEGKQGEDLIAYANEIKESGVLIYTLGFFEENARF